MWLLPWAQARYAGWAERIAREYPMDIAEAPAPAGTASAVAAGDPYALGEYVDDWGCVFQNIQRGAIGEAKAPLVPPEDEQWSDPSRIHIPYEWLAFGREAVNGFCARTDKFVLCAPCPRPFEQLQFIRGTEQLYIDLLEPPGGMLDFMGKMHSFYCELLEKWCETDIDAIRFMDDWGSQRALLINPVLWRSLFKPMYRDYINIAHRRGKKAFMHLDGHILEIVPDLIEMKLDALNSQLFCMGLENLAPFRGRLTFWGEIDRQHILRAGSLRDVRRAVRSVHDALWSEGGCIAQCDFGVGVLPENVLEVYRAWDELIPEDAGR
jgi:hypothetical protein